MEGQKAQREEEKKGNFNDPRCQDSEEEKRTLSIETFEYILKMAQGLLDEVKCKQLLRVIKHEVDIDRAVRNQFKNIIKTIYDLLSENEFI